MFAGSFFRRYPSIELSGLLNYIFFQLKDGNSFDLIVMKELLTKMSGLEQLIEGASDQQLEAMAGGETLKAEVPNAMHCLLTCRPSPWEPARRRLQTFAAPPRA